MEYQKEFRVVRKSENTNSFGLHQLVLTSKDGESYQTHASMYNAKEVGETMVQTIKSDSEGVIKDVYFVGCEMTTKLPQMPKEVLNEVFQ